MKYGELMSSVRRAAAIDEQVEPLQIVAAAGRRAAQRPSRCRGARRDTCDGGSTIGVTGPSGFDEVLVERPLHQPDDGAFDADHRVAPVLVVLGVARATGRRGRRRR